MKNFKDSDIFFIAACYDYYNIKNYIDSDKKMSLKYINYDNNFSEPIIFQNQ